MSVFCLIQPHANLYFQGLGTDEDTLIEILASRNNMEIEGIKAAYKKGMTLLETQCYIFLMDYFD